MKKIIFIILGIVVMGGGIYIWLSNNQNCLDGGAAWYFDRKFISLQDSDLYKNVVAKSSSCAKTTYEIREGDNFQKTNETKFNAFLRNYNNGCSNCLVYATRSMGINIGYVDYVTGKEIQKDAATLDNTTQQNSDLKTYTNTKYGYQIRYDSKIYTINAFGPEPKVNPNSDNVLFFKTADLNSPEPLATVAINVYPNPQKLSPEDYLKKNYQKWLGTPSNYSDFYVNEPTLFNGLNARKFGTERDRYILITKGTTAFTISTGDSALIQTFKFTR